MEYCKIVGYDCESKVARSLHIVEGGRRDLVEDIGQVAQSSDDDMAAP